MRKYWFLSLFLLIIFSFDRILKYYFLKNPAIGFGGDFFYGFLSFHFVKNYGMAFGLPFFSSVLVALIILILIFLVYFGLRLIKEKNYLLSFLILMIIIGAFSNLIDRIKFGFVVDYIDLTWFTVFNLADCLITVGVISFIFFTIKKD